MFRKLLKIPLELITPIFKMKNKNSAKCEFGSILIHKSGSYCPNYAIFWEKINLLNNNNFFINK